MVNVSSKSRQNQDNIDETQREVYKKPPQKGFNPLLNNATINQAKQKIKGGIKRRRDYIV